MRFFFSLTFFLQFGYFYNYNFFLVILTYFLTIATFFFQLWQTAIWRRVWVNDEGVAPRWRSARVQGRAAGRRWPLLPDGSSEHGRSASRSDLRHRGTPQRVWHWSLSFDNSDVHTLTSWSFHQKQKLWEIWDCSCNQMLSNLPASSGLRVHRRDGRPRWAGVTGTSARETQTGSDERQTDCIVHGLLREFEFISES